MKMFCPFCGNEMEDIEPEEVKLKDGKISYICYRKICRNKKFHYGNGNIVVPYEKV